jgi:hypothetical protein
LAFDLLWSARDPVVTGHANGVITLDLNEIDAVEREDYQQAIDRHYADGPPDDWTSRYVSAYATMHPWEEWAETFAHYLHIRDTLQTAEHTGCGWMVPRLRRPIPRRSSQIRAPAQDLEGLLRAWLALTYALNAINRSMGAEDLYPFVLPTEVQRKARLHRRLHTSSTGIHHLMALSPSPARAA